LKTQNLIPMSPNIDNHQDRLAEIFRQMDNQIIQESKVAFLKIQSWQFALRNLEARGFVVRLRDYDPADRLGIQFRLTIPSA